MKPEIAVFCNLKAKWETKMKKIVGLFFAAPLAAVLLSGAPAQAQQACPIKIGGTYPLTNSMGPMAKLMVQGAQLAVEHVNQGGGIKGCPIEYIMRDDQGQPNIGVDAAKYLVDVEHVLALSGGVSSGVSLPQLTSVVVPAKIPFVACCSTAATFTTLAQEGKTDGYFFHLMATVKTQAYGTAMEAMSRGLKRTAIIYINNDFGSGIAKYYAKALEKLGGKVVVSVPYNENQPSYRAEVNRALSEKPDSVFLASFPQDGATMTREWLSLGGTQNLILHNGLRNAEYVKLVGAKFLQKAFGFDNAAVEGPTVDAFRKSYKAKYNSEPVGTGILPQYDAIFTLALAMNIAPDLKGSSIRDSMRKIQDPNGTLVGTGPEEFKKALGLIKEGKPIKYSGATGPVEFDANGDVAGPLLIWSVKDGKLTVDKTITLDEIIAVTKKIDG
jgi:branched-chain amino acid transport system substrate-binding protein